MSPRLPDRRDAVPRFRVRLDSPDVRRSQKRSLVDELGLADDTVIIFTSDHGDYMGDHGLTLKLLLHYQGVIRVPFIWSDRTKTVSRETDGGLASSIDIAATILERAGIQKYNGMQERALLSTCPPEAVIVEEDSQRLMTGFDRPQRVRTVVTDRYRMSLREGEDWDELYDLAGDPEETRNIYDDPDACDARRFATEIMLRRLIELQDRSPLPAYRA